jgi:thioredoxin reductase
MGMERVPAFPISQLPGTIPISKIDDNIDPLPIAQSCLIHLQLLDSTLLTEETLWRDLFALTGTARTFNGPERIRSTWKELCLTHKAYGFKLAPGGATIMKPAPTLAFINAKFSFKTQGSPALNCMGIMRLIPDEQQSWRIWTLVTLLHGIEGFPNVDVLEPAMEWETNTLLTPVSDPGEETIQDCVVVGAGMSGLCTAGHLKAAGINALIVERNAAVGQNWTDRYDSVKIHTSRACGQLPFKPIWGPEYPYHLAAADLDVGYQKFVKTYGLNVWLSSNLEKARWNDKTKTWALVINQRGMCLDMKARRIVLAIGGGGSVPNTPKLANRDAFNGTVMHSADYKNAKQWAGLRGVVIGSANSAHDIANDMLEAGCSSTTMVQRGTTPVLPVEYYRKIYDKTYNDNIPVHDSDLMTITTPTAISRLMAMRAISKFASEEPERFDSLQRQGFKVERNMDLYHCLYERFGGHYVDVGVSKKISAGLIKMKSDAALTGFSATGLVFADGSTLDADVVVFATGFEANMRLAARDLVGPEVGDKLEDWWGVDYEGELRGAWKPIGRISSSPFFKKEITNSWVC